VHFGEAQLALQRALLRLQQHGRLICLASKNEEQDVLDVFKLRGACLKKKRGS
jgi:predicted enzyme involved in methoxymalonyl-ACP biosynthesis